MAQSKKLFSYYKQCKLKIEAVNVLIKAECTPYTSYKIKIKRGYVAQQQLANLRTQIN